MSSLPATNEDDSAPYVPSAPHPEASKPKLDMIRVRTVDTGGSEIARYDLDLSTATRHDYRPVSFVRTKKDGELIVTAANTDDYDFDYWEDTRSEVPTRTISSSEVPETLTAVYFRAASPEGKEHKRQKAIKSQVVAGLRPEDEEEPAEMTEEKFHADDDEELGEPTTSEAPSSSTTDQVAVPSPDVVGVLTG